MPRNGSSLYYIPPGTEGFPDTTIESAKYNTYIHDVETDLNLPRPIVSGGTGANDADEALANLHAEKAGQEVDNFDSYAFMAGSFYSTISTTAPPVAGHLFSGIAHIANASNMVLEAVDLSDAPHTPWIRVKTAGAWGPWMPRAIVTASDTPPTGSQANDNALWWESDTGILYIRYNDGNSTQWVVASPVPDVSSYLTQAEFSGSAVRYDTPQALSGPEQQQALQNIYAAPADAMAYSGMQINGGMDVSQELGATPSSAGGYVCDGWKQNYVSGNMVAAQSPTSIFSGFPFHFGMQVNTPVPSLAAGDFYILWQSIEGYRIARLAWGTANAQPITLGFWTAHHRAGLYSGSIRNNPSGSPVRSYAFTYTQASADVPQYNTVTVPGDTTGPWATNNTAGMTLTFSSGSGATSTAPSANTWLTGSYQAAPGHVNAIAATSDVFRLTGVTVLPGIEAPSAGRSAFLMRPYDQELVTCQRYWARGNAGYYNYVTSGQINGSVQVAFPVTMRAIPTLSGANQAVTGFSATVNFINSTSHETTVYHVASAPGAASFVDTWTADARL